MCQYAYSQFAQCNHRLVEITSFCCKALWHAGISGQLSPCPEISFHYQLAQAFNPSASQNTNSTPEVETTHFWRGMSGFCRACVCRYKMPKLIPTQTYHNTPLSTFPSLEVVSKINSYNGPSLPTTRVTPPVEHPYVYLPFINRALYELLKIEDQYNEKHQNSCKVLFFPSVIFLYTSSFERWMSPAHIDGVVVKGVPDAYFALNCGLTPLDRRDVGEEVAKGRGLREVWRMKYAGRGTHLEMFLKVAAKGEVYPPKKVETAVKFVGSKEGGSSTV